MTPYGLMPWNCRLVAKYLCSAPSSIKHGMQYLAPIIEERLKWAEEDKDSSLIPVNSSPFPACVSRRINLCDKNDLISWLLDQASPERRTIRSLTQMVLVVNFAAIHTSSMVHPTLSPSCNDDVNRLWMFSEFHPRIIPPSGSSRSSLCSSCRSQSGC